MPAENVYQAGLIRRMKDRPKLKGCVVIKNDPNLQQGILDLSIFLGPRWAMLEVKASARSRLQPNQQYYLDLLNGMSYASLIYPEIEEEVLSEMELALTT